MYQMAKRTPPALMTDEELALHCVPTRRERFFVRFTGCIPSVLAVGVVIALTIGSNSWSEWQRIGASTLLAFVAVPILACLLAIAVSTANGARLWRCSVELLNRYGGGWECCDRLANAELTAEDGPDQIAFLGASTVEDTTVRISRLIILRVWERGKETRASLDARQRHHHTDPKRGPDIQRRQLDLDEEAIWAAVELLSNQPFYQAKPPDQEPQEGQPVTRLSCHLRIAQRGRAEHRSQSFDLEPVPTDREEDYPSIQLARWLFRLADPGTEDPPSNVELLDSLSPAS